MNALKLRTLKKRASRSRYEKLRRYHVRRIGRHTLWTDRAWAEEMIGGWRLVSTPARNPDE